MADFEYKNHSVYSPPGSIMEYLGTDDPDGWVICNGVVRTNNADGRYNTLNSMGIGTGGNQTSNYTPPNLSGKYLYGKGSSDTIGGNIGNSSITLNTEYLGSHNHEMEHVHYISLRAANQRYGWVLNVALRQYSGITYGTVSTTTPYNFITNSAGQPDISGRTPMPNTFNTGESSPTAINLLPPYYVINYILKY